MKHPLEPQWTIVLCWQGGAEEPTGLYFWTKRGAERWTTTFDKYPPAWRRHEVRRITDLADPPVRNRRRDRLATAITFVLVLPVVYGTEAVLGRELAWWQVFAVSALTGIAVRVAAGWSWRYYS